MKYCHHYNACWIREERELGRVNPDPMLSMCFKWDIHKRKSEHDQQHVEHSFEVCLFKPRCGFKQVEDRRAFTSDVTDLNALANLFVAA